MDMDVSGLKNQGLALRNTPRFQKRLKIFSDDMGCASLRRFVSALLIVSFLPPDVANCGDPQHEEKEDVYVSLPPSPSVSPQDSKMLDVFIEKRPAASLPSKAEKQESSFCARLCQAFCPSKKSAEEEADAEARRRENRDPESRQGGRFVYESPSQSRRDSRASLGSPSVSNVGRSTSMAIPGSPSVSHLGRSASTNVGYAEALAKPRYAEALAKPRYAEALAKPRYAEALAKANGRSVSVAPGALEANVMRLDEGLLGSASEEGCAGKRREGQEQPGDDS